MQAHVQPHACSMRNRTPHHVFPPNVTVSARVHRGKLQRQKPHAIYACPTPYAPPNLWPGALWREQGKPFQLGPQGAVTTPVPDAGPAASSRQKMLVTPVKAD